MRILFVVETISPHAARWIRQFADGGWDIHVFQAVAPGHGLAGGFPPATFHVPTKWPAEPGSTVHCTVGPMRALAEKILTRSERGRIFAKRLLEEPHQKYLNRLIAKLQPDVVHSLGLNVNWVNLCLPVLRARKALGEEFRSPWLYSSWGTDLDYFARMSDDCLSDVRSVLREVDYFIAECRRDVRLAGELGFHGELAGMFPAFGGVDLDQILPHRQKGDVSARKRIFLKGRDCADGDPVARGMTAIRAFELCKDALAGYEIVISQASPVVAREAQALVARAGLNIRVLPHVPYGEILDFIGSSRLAIAMTVNDGLPSVLVEMMSLGALPLHSDLESIREWVSNGVNGLLVPAEDPQAAAAAIRRALADDELVNRAAEINHAQVLAKLEAKAVAAAAKAMYEHVASAGRNGREVFIPPTASGWLFPLKRTPGGATKTPPIASGHPGRQAGEPNPSSRPSGLSPKRNPRILFVAMPNSIHVARWISQLSGQGWDVHLFPSTVAGLRYDLRHVTLHCPLRPPGGPPGEASPPPRLRALRGTAVAAAVRKMLEWAIFPSRVRKLMQTIRQVQPDIVQSLEFQRAGYLCLAARRRMGEAFPTWIVTNYGNDIYHFGRFSGHRAKIRAILEQCDYYSCECRRDVRLAKEMGLRGEALAVLPNAGGFDLKQAASLRQTGPASARRTIALKGYQGWAGRARVALAALRLCAEDLRGYRVAIYLANPQTQKEAKEVCRAIGVPLDVIAPCSHQDMLRLYGRSRVYIGLSVTDGASTSLLEAIVMGAFPIQSNTACADEWIECGDNGLIVPPEDPAAAAAAISRALRDDALVDRAEKANAKLARQRLDYSVVQAVALEYYRRIGQRAGQKPSEKSEDART